MHLVFLCVIEICNALDVLILDRVSKRKKPAASLNDDDVVAGSVEEVNHHDKTGLGSEAWKHNQPLDVESEGLLCSLRTSSIFSVFIKNNPDFGTQSALGCGIWGSY